MTNQELEKFLPRKMEGVTSATILALRHHFVGGISIDQAAEKLCLNRVTVFRAAKKVRLKMESSGYKSRKRIEYYKD